jgi:hypothetical protein
VYRERPASIQAQGSDGRHHKDRSLSDGFQVFATRSLYCVGSWWAFVVAVFAILLLGTDGAAFPLLRYAATRGQYRHDDRDLPDGVSYSEHVIEMLELFT